MSRTNCTDIFAYIREKRDRERELISICGKHTSNKFCFVPPVLFQIRLDIESVALLLLRTAIAPALRWRGFSYNCVLATYREIEIELRVRIPVCVCMLRSISLSDWQSILTFDSLSLFFFFHVFYTEHLIIELDGGTCDFFYVELNNLWEEVWI